MRIQRAAVGFAAVALKAVQAGRRFRIPVGVAGRQVGAGLRLRTQGQQAHIVAHMAQPDQRLAQGRRPVQRVGGGKDHALRACEMQVGAQHVGIGQDAAGAGALQRRQHALQLARAARRRSEIDAAVAAHHQPEGIALALRDRGHASQCGAREPEFIQSLHAAAWLGH